MNLAPLSDARDLSQRLFEAEATIEALLSGQIDAVVDSKSMTPVLLAKAQEALRASEERYRRIVETTNEGIWTVDTDCNITFVNRRLAELLGHPAEEMLGQSLFRFLPEMSGARASFCHDGSDEAVSEEREAEFMRRDGTCWWALLKTTPTRDVNGRRVGTLGMMTNRTSHRQAEEARKELYSQLMVSDRMASVGTLAAGVAHGINNPLAALMLCLEYAKDSLLGPKAPGLAAPGREDRDKDEAWLVDEVIKPLDDARAAAERVRAIVRDLKMFSRSPDDAPTGPTDVKTVIDSSLRMAWNEIRHRARVIKRETAVPLVAVSEGRLGQVFLNLIVNAAQAMPEGHAESNRIAVSTRLEDDRVVVEVSDTGAGIPPETLGRIFDAFFTTKPVGVGTGLGLAICHRIVTDVGGELTVRSEVGKGTTFRVTLPIARQKLRLAVASPLELSAVPRRGRVLLVDDEVLVVRALSRTLARDHDVTTTVAAKEALAMCRAGEQFDVILCDLMMPEMTGMDLYGELRAVAPEQARRMVFLTGGAFTAKAQTFLAETPNEHLEKPLDPASLRAVVQRLLRQ